MAFSDWEQVITSGMTAVSLDTVNTIVGTSALRLIGGSGSSYVTLIPTLASMKPHGLKKGKLRMLVEPVALAGARRLGFSSMHAFARTGAGGSGAYCCYSAHVDGSLVVLAKYTFNGTLNAPSIVLQSAAYSLIVDTVFSFEFQWIVSLEDIGGVDLVVRIGSALDFSDLTEILHIIDSTSPITTTFADGIFFAASGSPAGVSEFRLDQTSLFRIL